jgi:hypothetical protein
MSEATFINDKSEAETQSEQTGGFEDKPSLSSTSHKTTSYLTLRETTIQWDAWGGCSPYIHGTRSRTVHNARFTTFSGLMVGVGEPDVRWCLVSDSDEHSPPTPTTGGKTSFPGVSVLQLDPAKAQPCGACFARFAVSKYCYDWHAVNVRYEAASMPVNYS